MSYLEDVWDRENERREENYKNNMKYFTSLSYEEKVELMWREYVDKHCNDLRG